MGQAFPDKRPDSLRSRLPHAPGPALGPGADERRNSMRITLATFAILAGILLAPPAGAQTAPPPAPVVAPLVAAAPAPAAAQPSGRQIAELALEANRLDGSEAVMTLVIENGKGQQRVRKLAAVSKLVDGGRTEKKLSRFLSPADVKGTGFLSFDHATGDDDMWLYLPALRKTRRIVSSEKAKSFMGSEFTYADMNLPNLDDFAYTVLREEPVEGVPCWVVEATPRDADIADDHGYSKRVAWFGKEDHSLRRALYYDLQGEILKELGF